MGAHGTIMSSNALASVVAPLTVPPLAAAIGWRAAFLSAAAVGVVVHLAVRLWLPAPRDRSDDGAAPSGPVPVRDTLRMKVLWRFALMLFGYATLMWGLSTWIPSYLHSERGVSLSHAGVLMAVPSLGAAAATMLGGRLSDRLEGHHRKVILPAMAAAAPAVCLMALSPSLAGSVICGTVAVVAGSSAICRSSPCPCAASLRNRSASAAPSS